MAFWIGAFVGSFMATVVVPLFFFYFAGRKGRKPRAALILRIVAVVVAILGAVASTVGSGGQFPAGAVLAVVVCFVWAFRVTLRERGMHLNGWQRLGVVASVLWLPVGFFSGNWWWIQSNGAPWLNLYQLCIEAPNATQAALTECGRQFDANYSSAVAGQCWAGLATAVTALLLAWGIAWVCVRLYRWIRGGFAPDEA